MTVSEIVKDLLEYNMITAEAALVLLKAESQASINNINTFPKTNGILKVYDEIPCYNGTTATPDYFSTTTSLDSSTGKLIDTI